MDLKKKNNGISDMTCKLQKYGLKLLEKKRIFKNYITSNQSSFAKKFICYNAILAWPGSMM